MNNSKRPKVDLEKLKMSPFERLLSVISIISFIGSVIFLLYMWSKLPEQVPAHFDASGAVDRFGSKWELIILPIVGLLLYLFMHVIGKYPHVHNYPIEITEENAQQAYQISYSLIGTLKNAILILFSLLVVNSIIVAIGWGEGIGLIFLLIIFIGTGLPIIIAIVKLMKLS